MTPDTRPDQHADCDRCGLRFEVVTVPAECPKCGTTVRRLAGEPKPVDPVAERFRLAAQRAKGNF